MALIVYEHIERDPVRILFIRRVLDCNHYIPIKYKKQVKLYHGLCICVSFKEPYPNRLHPHRLNFFIPVCFKLLRICQHFYM